MQDDLILESIRDLVLEDGLLRWEPFQDGSPPTPYSGVGYESEVGEGWRIRATSWLVMVYNRDAKHTFYMPKDRNGCPSHHGFLANIYAHAESACSVPSPFIHVARRRLATARSLARP